MAMYNVKGVSSNGDTLLHLSAVCFGFTAHKCTVLIVLAADKVSD